MYRIRLSKHNSWLGLVCKKIVEEKRLGYVMGELPLAAVDRIIRKATGVRVSEEAAKALAEQLEEMGMTISREASVFAKHANRKTITGADIKLAIKK